MQTEKLYVAFGNEAGSLEKLPPVLHVKLNKVSLAEECYTQEGCCLSITEAGRALQSPSSVADGAKVNSSNIKHNNC